MSDTRGSERLLIEVKRLEAENERLREEKEQWKALSYVDAAELARLHRIEKAARELLTRVSPDWTTALRAALKESA